MKLSIVYDVYGFFIKNNMSSKLTLKTALDIKYFYHRKSQPVKYLVIEDLIYIEH